MTSSPPTPLPPPLDETVFSQPALLQSWGGLSSDNILFYLSHSPFYDPTSNNAITTTQAQFNPALASILHSRHAFEAHLRSMAGVEFVVGHDPTISSTLTATARAQGQGQGQPTAGIVDGPWVIRKQNRIKMGPGQEDRIEVLAEYFVVGDRIFQAPTLAAVLGARMLASARALGELVSKTGGVAEFTAARGHGYISGSASGSGSGVEVEGRTEIVGAAGRGVGIERNGSNGSKTNEVLATQQKDVESLGDDDEDDEEEDTQIDETLFLETLMNHTSYAKIYMDENPLVGEPGNFRVSKNGTEVSLRNALTTSTGNVNGNVNGSGNTKGLGGVGGLPALTLKTDLASVVGATSGAGTKGGGKGGKEDVSSGGKTPVSATVGGNGLVGGRKKKKDRNKSVVAREGKGTVP